MPGALSIIRLALVSPHFLKNHPIQVYAIASRWNWQEEAEIASSYTVGMDLLSKDVIDKLRVVDPPDLTRLMLFHRKRRDQLKRGLDSQDIFYANIVPGRCQGCDHPNMHEKWHRMKYDWVTGFEHRPMDASSRDLLERLELADVLSATCLRCQKRLYNAESTISNLRQILEKLPKHVEVCVVCYYGCLWDIQLMILDYSSSRETSRVSPASPHKSGRVLSSLLPLVNPYVGRGIAVIYFVVRS